MLGDGLSRQGGQHLKKNDLFSYNKLLYHYLLTLKFDSFSISLYKAHLLTEIHIV